MEIKQIRKNNKRAFTRVEGMQSMGHTQSFAPKQRVEAEMANIHNTVLHCLSNDGFRLKAGFW